MTTTATTQTATFDTGRSPKIHVQGQAVLVIVMNHSHTEIFRNQTSDICTTISVLDERSEEGVVDVSAVEEACGVNAHFEMVNGSDSFITWPPQEENTTLSASSNVICQATDESNSSLIVVSNSVVIHDVSFDDGDDTNIDDGGDTNIDGGDGDDGDGTSDGGGGCTKGSIGDMNGYDATCISCGKF